MRVLHITPHLGGGIGKALAVISRELPKDVEQTFVLLEKPIDQRCVGMLRSNGNTVVVAESLDHIAKLAGEADIVQFEFINHPRLLECIARTEWPLMRCLFWAHISGLFKPIIQPKLMEAAQFVFTSKASLPLGTYPVINSGFGFGSAVRPRIKRLWPQITYLGTVNFIKMHPCFFDIVDNISHVGPVSVYGHIEKMAKFRAENMRHPQRVKLLGETLHPADALSKADIFLYPLQPKHYGTGENALIEAMSIGLVPVVMNNSAEAQIVTHNKNGLVANSTDECIEHIDSLMASPTLRERLSKNAIEYVKETKSPKESANHFVNLWQCMMDSSVWRYDFKSAIGDTPLKWFLATQELRGSIEAQEFKGISKGSLAHFKKVFAGDASFDGIG